jgi:hypothetical protein
MPDPTTNTAIPPTSDRTRRMIETAATRAEQVSKRFWLLDLKFEQFVTPKLLGVMWTLYLLLTALGIAAFVAYAMWTLPVVQAAIAIGVYLLATVFGVMLVRVILETFLVAFRAVERLKPLQNLAYLQPISASIAAKATPSQTTAV